ncbi:putative membrane protein [Gottschalkia purinilytica]|uniref:Putative membrane protein n=1 Tax=Gottschalkia purinilytica TaxID=1503 RepID=A0A0L0W950_GOTPU|nr:manganese efflux pump [Gottschalkia purinilytica]KNF08083.1 putative membrane protein [Gottschalkia purinilytica]
MSIIDLSLVSFALALDAFGVAISVGLDKNINKRIALAFVFSFGFFQFLFASMGGICGSLFNTYVFQLPSKIGGIIILLVGVLMFKEGFSEEKEVKKLNIFLVLLLGICVSIDALVVGFSTFNNIDFKSLIFKNTIFIGMTSSFLTVVAFMISKKIKKNKFINEYMDFLGGLILIIFGLKMILF